MKAAEKALSQATTNNYETAPRGAEILMHALVTEGVETIFGYPGGAVLHIYDEIWRHRDSLTHYLVRHEQGAVHAADGYARATGRPGVVLVTSGPGATNAVTGIATAYLDSVPMVIITGQVPTHLIGTDAFQEVDTIGITMPCVKHNYLVRDVADLAAVVHEAFHLATTGRPGPVLIDIPKDISAARTNYTRLENISFPLRARRWPPQPAEVSAAVTALLAAQKPIVYMGGGVVTADAGAELLQLVETLDLPVTPTLMGLGGFPSAHRACLGMLGMHGTWTANMAVAEADLLVAVGVRFDDRVTGKLATFAPHARILHIDIDPANVGKNVAPQMTLVADAREALAALNAEIARREASEVAASIAQRAAWWDKLRAWQLQQPLSYEGSAHEIKPQTVLRELSQLTDNNALIVTDVGQHQMWAAQFYPYRRTRQWLTSGGLGTMGFGVPAAMGAKLACPHEQVIAIVGDGGFQMTNQELATAVQYSIPVKILIMNNGYLGMVRQWQEMFYDRSYSEVDMSVAPDFVKLTEAYGAAAFRAVHPAELREKLQAWLDAPGVAVIDVVVAKEENVFPIVPPGGDANQMLLRADGV